MSVKRYGLDEKGVFAEVRADGLYLILNNRLNKDTMLAKNPMMLFEHTGAEGINAETLESAFKSRSEDVEVKLSDSVKFSVADETAQVIISKDGMDAQVMFYQGHPWFGARLSGLDIINTLKNAGVVYGVLTDMINDLQTNRPPHGKSVVVAVGRQAINGENGSLEYNIDINKQNNKPKVMENGNVDYKNVDRLLQVHKGDVLVEVVEFSTGIDGMNVKGEKIPSKPGRPAPRLPKGKNTVISEDGKFLIAEIDGLITINNNRIDVLPTLNIAGDVGYTTGNIDFAGSVFVEGTVLHGFSVKATGDVEIKGALEGAVIEAGGNVNLLGGVKGVGKSVISAGGDIFARYVERAKLVAGGDITSDSIMHSDVRCDGHLVVEGKKGLLVGGVIYAGKSVTAKTIGSSMATATEITVGNSPDFIIRYNELAAAYKKVKDDYDKERLIEAYKAGNEDLKLRSLHARIHLRVEMDKIQNEMNELLVLLNSKDGIVRASQVINCGCKIIVGGVLIKVQDELTACTLRNKDDRVAVGPYISY